MMYKLDSKAKISKKNCVKALVDIEDKIEESLRKGNTIVCPICGKDIVKRFRSACKISSNDGTINIFPVHIDCIDDHVPIESTIKNDEVMLISTVDLLTLLDMRKI